jgi:hypothetical protein
VPVEPDHRGRRQPPDAEHEGRTRGGPPGAAGPGPCEHRLQQALCKGLLPPAAPDQAPHPHERPLGRGGQHEPDRHHRQREQVAPVGHLAGREAVGGPQPGGKAVVGRPALRPEDRDQHREADHPRDRAALFGQRHQPASALPEGQRQADDHERHRRPGRVHVARHDHQREGRHWLPHGVGERLRHGVQHGPARRVPPGRRRWPGGTRPRAHPQQEADVRGAGVVVARVAHRPQLACGQHQGGRGQGDGGEGQRGPGHRVVGRDAGPRGGIGRHHGIGEGVGRQQAQQKGRHEDQHARPFVRPRGQAQPGGVVFAPHVPVAFGHAHEARPRIDAVAEHGEGRNARGQERERLALQHAQQHVAPLLAEGGEGAEEQQHRQHVARTPGQVGDAGAQRTPLGRALGPAGTEVEAEPPADEVGGQQHQHAGQQGALGAGQPGERQIAASGRPHGRGDRQHHRQCEGRALQHAAEAAGARRPRERPQGDEGQHRHDPGAGPGPDDLEPGRRGRHLKQGSEVLGRIDRHQRGHQHRDEMEDRIGHVPTHVQRARHVQLPPQQPCGLQQAQRVQRHEQRGVEPQPAPGEQQAAEALRPVRHGGPDRVLPLPAEHVAQREAAGQAQGLVPGQKHQGGDGHQRHEPQPAAPAAQAGHHPPSSLLHPLLHPLHGLPSLSRRPPVGATV